MFFDRRDFLKLSLAGISSLALPIELFGEEENSNEYKAIVVIYHSGGNDGLNMFIPSSDDEKSGYPSYANIRDTLRVDNNELILPLDDNGNLDLSQGNPYATNNSLPEAYTKGFYKHDGLDVATNGLMPEIAHLVNKGKVAIVANLGNLIEPATKEELRSKTKPLPPFLFAHNHQTKLTMNGIASKLDFTGWAGRVYDNWQNINGGDIYGLNIAINRTEHLFYGAETTPLILSQNGPTEYFRIKRDMYDNYMDIEKGDKYRRYYNRIKKHSFEMQDTLVDDWQNNSPTWESKNAYGGELFKKPTSEELSQSKPIFADGSLLRQFKAVAKLAYIGKNRGLKRQIFFVFDGGYDTHSNQTNQHSKKIRGLSLALGDFYIALKEMGMENSVTTLTISDFGRSTGNNGDGTDHAWGGTYFVMGGAVKGGLYGKMPDLTLGSNDDFTKKGRLIPTTSMSQYYGTVLKWFGINDDLMPIILPELKNFDVKDLGFMS
jgi:uncharacterized protein (DUF1501 family)